MKYRLVIFDFDGTLADSFQWFISVMDKVANKYKFKRIEKSDIEPMRNSNASKMLKHHGIPFWKLPFIGKHFRKLMTVDINKISLCEGVDNLLKRLSEEDITLAVVSSNSYENITKILGPINATLFKYFECDVSIFGKPPKIKKIIKQSGIQYNKVIFIGDEIRDIDAARKVKIKFGAVSWGYTKIEALKAHSPDEVFTKVEEILEKLI